MLLNARKVIYETSPTTNILLAFTDVTARRAVEHEKEALLFAAEAMARDKRSAAGDGTSHRQQSADPRSLPDHASSRNLSMCSVITAPSGGHSKVASPPS